MIDNLGTGRRENLNSDAEFINADVCDIEVLKASLKGVDCVLHNAALARVPLSIELSVRTHMVSLVGTLNVLLAARDLGVRRVVYAGSSSVYVINPSCRFAKRCARTRLIRTPCKN